jgi:mRNA interferase YafQ
MYEIVQTKKFEKALKRLVRGGLKESVQKDIQITINTIAAGQKLDACYKDHQLQGNLAMCRECHIQGDLLLVYKIDDGELILILVDIGSHSKLFL